MRKFNTFEINDCSLFIRKLLRWSRDFKRICVLNSNDYRKISDSPHAHHSYDLIAAIGSIYEFMPEGYKRLASLDKFIENSGDWIFGHLSYDLKNEIEALSSQHPDNIKFPLISFFIPKFIFLIKKKTLRLDGIQNSIVKMISSKL